MTERWDVNAIVDMEGAPLRPDPNKPGLHIPVRIRVEPVVPFDIPVMRLARDEDEDEDVRGTAIQDGAKDAHDCQPA